MMRWIVGSSMHFRLLVIAVAGVVMFFGFRQMRDMPVDMLPEFSEPYVEVQTEALGLSAAEVEALITTPLEADMLNGCPWVKEIRSESIPGLSSIVLIFEPGTDILDARQAVQERLTEVFTLPNVSKSPTMLNPLSSTARVMKVGLTSDKLSPVEISVLARWTIKPRLMGIPGVANVSIWGQRERQLQVLVDPHTLRDKQVTLNQIISTTGNALWVSPLSFLNASTPGTGGWIETPNQRLAIRHLLPISTPEQLAQVTVEGTNMRLGDVAQVVETHQPLIGDAIVNDDSNLMLVIEKFPWANTVEVTQAVDEALLALSHGLGGLRMDSTLYRPATFIEAAMANLSSSLVTGGVLAALALFAFFFNWRTTLVAIVAILVSVFAALMVLHYTGTPLNMLVIAGLTLALVAIIDDAVGDVCNVSRRLRALPAGADETSTMNTIQAAALELRGALGYATVMLVLAVAPLFLIDGAYGAFFRAIAYPYALAIVVSMVVGLTVTAALSLTLLTGRLAEHGTPFGRLLERLFDTAVARAAHSPKPVFIGLCVLLAAGLLLASRLERDELLPRFKETELMVNLDGLAGTSHPAMARIVSKLTHDLRAVPGVRNVSAHVGRAVMSDEVSNINASELWVSLDPKADHDRTVAAIQEVVDDYPGLDRAVLTYTQERIEDIMSDEPVAATVRVYGDDFNVIRSKAEEVAAALEKIPGVRTADVEYPSEEASLEIEVDMEKVKQYGLKPGDVRRSATALLSGIEAGNLFEQQKVFEVVVWGTPETRHSLTNVRELVIDTPTGEHVTLGDVADIRFAPAESVIERETVARRVDVKAQISRTADYAALSAEIERVLEKIEFPLEYRAELLAGYGDRMANWRRVIGVAAAAVIGIFLLMQVAFRKWRLAAAVLVSLPVALVGGVAAVYVTGNVVTLGALCGFVAVLTIALRNGMSLVKHYQNLEQHEGEAFGPALVQRGTRERFAPIVMSAIVTALVFFPLAVYGNAVGLEIVSSMAVVVLGGLVTTSLLSLVGVPVVYLLFGANPEPELFPELQTAEHPSTVLGGPAIQPAT